MATQAFRQRRVVVLDDNELLLRSLARLLEVMSEGTQTILWVETARTPDAARTLCASLPRPALVVCDYRLGGETSAGLVRELVLAGHQVVVTTGSPLEAEQELAGIAPVMPKPMSMERLEELVTAL